MDQVKGPCGSAGLLASIGIVLCALRGRKCSTWRSLMNLYNLLLSRYLASTKMKLLYNCIPRAYSCAHLLLIMCHCCMPTDLPSCTTWPTTRCSVTFATIIKLLTFNDQVYIIRFQVSNFSTNLLHNPVQMSLCTFNVFMYFVVRKVKDWMISGGLELVGAIILRSLMSVNVS